MSGLAASLVRDRDFSPARYNNNNVRFYGTKEKLQWAFEKGSHVCKSGMHVLGRCWSWKLIHFFQILEDRVQCLDPGLERNRRTRSLVIGINC